MSNAKQDQGLKEVLDDLCARFLVNLPASEYESFERLFFAIESAHWFYDDFYRENNPKLPKLQLKAFAGHMFDHTPLLQPYRSDLDKIFTAFRSYKHEVPTCGAAMLNSTLDKVVLVRGWGNNARWGFPKGKMAKDETELQAAVREVREETGFDLEDYINAQTYYIDSMTGGRLNRIFVVSGIPENTHFETQTRKEISKIEWIPVSALPDFGKKQIRAQNQGAQTADAAGAAASGGKQYFHVAQYVGRLKSWIKRQKKNMNEGPRTGKQAAGGPGAEKRTRQDKNERAGRTEKSDRKEKGDSSRTPRSSPNRGKKAKREKKRIDARDIETFGSASRAGGLSNKDRDNLYKLYIQDTEERAKQIESGIQLWPPVGVGTEKREVGEKRSLYAFSFDKDAILACLA